MDKVSMKKIFWGMSAVFVFLLMIGGAFLFNDIKEVKAAAPTCYWTASTSLDMAVASNWDDGSGNACAPTSSYALQFGEHASASTTANAENNGDLEAYKIFLKSDYTGTVSLNSGNITSTNGLNINGGTLNFYSGTLSLGSEFFVGSSGTFDGSVGTGTVYIYVGGTFTGRSGATTLYNLTINGVNVSFAAGTTVITNNFTVIGFTSYVSCASAGTTNLTFYGSSISETSGGLFDTDNCSLTYGKDGAVNILDDTYYDLIVSSTNASIIGDTTITNRLTINTSGVLNAGSYTLTLSGRPTTPALNTPFVKNGTFNANSSTLLYTNIAGSITVLKNVIYNNLTVGAGGSGSYTFGAALPATITSTGNVINNTGSTITLGATDLIVLGDYTNNGTMTLSAGGRVKKASSGGFTAASYVPVTTNALASVSITDPTANLLADTAETINVTVTSTNGDTEYLVLTESGIATGIFNGSINFTLDAANSPMTDDDNVLNTPGSGTLYLTYGNGYGTSTVTATFSTGVASPPSDQDTVYATTSTVAHGASVSITASTISTNTIWFAPYTPVLTDTSSFVASATMVSTTGDATTILAPETPGTYRLYVINEETGVSSPSVAVLYVKPYNQDETFTSDRSVVAGNTTTIVGNAFAGTYLVTFATSTADMAYLWANIPSGGNGASSTVSMRYPYVSTTTYNFVPSTADTYNLFTALLKGGLSANSASSWVLSDPSTSTLTVTGPTSQDTVFSVSTNTLSDAVVTVTSTGNASNTIYFSTSTNFDAGANVVTQAAGDATSILSPNATGTYYLYVEDYWGNASAPSVAVLTVNSTTPEMVLAAAKVTAKAEVAGALAAYSEGDYTPGNWVTLNAFHTDGDVAIDAATTTALVTVAKNTAIDGMDAVETVAETLAAAKVTAKADVATALSGYVEEDYSGSNWTTLNAFHTDGDVAIDAAGDLAGVATAKNTAINGMAGVSTLVEEAKAITTFDFNGLDPAVVGAVNEGAKTIALTVPHGTAVTTLTPTIVQTGASVSPASGVPQNFTSPVTYTVTAQDSSTQAYVVTVTIASSTAKQITTFAFTGLGSGTIDQDLRTIAVEVPYGTTVTALEPVIVVSDHATVDPASGEATDFTSPVTYTVTAQNNSTTTYEVTVTFGEDFVATAFDAIAATVSSTGITNNMQTVTGADVTAFSGLYFEKPGFGRITYTGALDLSATTTKTFLEGIGAKLDMATLGSVDFDARDEAGLQAAGAQIAMYGLSGFGGLTNSTTFYGKLTVRDDDGNVTTTGDIVSGATYSAGTFTFDVAHFTKFDIDITAPVITVTGGNVNIYEGTEYVDAGATALDAIDGTIIVSTTEMADIDTSTPAVYTVTYTATDTASNIATTTRTVEVLTVSADAQVITTTVEASTSTPTILIGDNSSGTSTITIPEAITDPIYLDFSGLTVSTTFPLEIDADVSTTIGLVEVEFQDGTVITGPAGWDGTISLPVLQTSSSASITESGKTNTTQNVIELGYTGGSLTFDKAVKITIPGQVAGVKVAYNNGGSSVDVPVCTAGQLADPETLTAAGNCYSQSGSVVTIWTKHLTDFFTYTQTTDSTGSSGGSGPGLTIIPTVGANPVLINNGATKTNSRVVTLKFDAVNASTVAVSEDSTFTGASWEAYTAYKTFTLSAGNGVKTVYIKFRSTTGNTTATFTKTITLDVAAANINLDANCTALIAGDMIKVVGKPAIYVLDNNKNYRYFSDGDVFKSWNMDENYSKYYKSVTQACFNALSQPASAPYHVFYRPGSEIVKYLSSDKLYVVGLNNTLYPITSVAAKAIFGTTYKVKTIGLSEWPYYTKSASTIAQATIYPGMLVKVGTKTYFVDEGNVMREVTTAGMTSNQFKAAYVRTLSASTVAGFGLGETITSKVSTLSTR